MLFDEFIKNYNLDKIKDTKEIQEALTHRSIKSNYSYEKFELLGDSVLNLAVVFVLMEKFPMLNEGEIAKKKSFLISKNICLKVGNEIGLKEVMKIGASITNKTSIERILADVMEAILGVIFLYYGFEKITEIIEDNFLKYLSNFQDPKTILQEITQKYYKCLPVYVTIDKKGPDHEPIFKIQLTVQDQLVVVESTNKKLGEILAAKEMLHVLNY